MFECVYMLIGSVKMNTSNISNYKTKDFALLKKLKKQLILEQIRHYRKYENLKKGEFAQKRNIQK